MWLRNTDNFLDSVIVDGETKQRFTIVGSERIGKMIEVLEKKIKQIESVRHLYTFKGNPFNSNPSQGNAG